MKINEKADKIITDVKNELREVLGDKLVELILFGSYAKGKESSQSDIDIMLLVDEDQESLRRLEDKITEISFELSLEYDLVLSIILKSYQQFKNYSDVLPFYMNVENEGIKVYERKAS